MSSSNSTTIISIEHRLNENSSFQDPHAKSLTLQFRMTLEEKRKWREFKFFDSNVYIDCFQKLETYLKEHPEAELEELHIEFMPEVILYLCIPNYHVVDYDRYGPIYEDEEWTVHTTDHIPSKYFFVLCEDSFDVLDKIGKALLKLLSVRTWKALTIPYHFPAAGFIAEDYPFATFTEEVDEDESHETLSDYIRHLHQAH